MTRHVAPFCCELNSSGGHVTHFSIGPNGDLVVLVCMGPRDERWIEREYVCDWRVLSISPFGACSELFLPSLRNNYNLAQPLPNGWLLATSRCRFSEAEVQPNGHIFSFEGKLIESLLLGDGINEVQSTKSGNIWIAYFDEGVFGNLGWNSPIGSSGLRQVNRSGKCLFEFRPTSGLGSIADCYALNVTSRDEVWCCYYTDFPIVRISGNRIAEHWPSPIQGPSAFCVWRDSVLLQGGYDSKTVWQLVQLQNGEEVQILESFEFVTSNGAMLENISARARGDTIWFVEQNRVYRISLKDLLRCPPRPLSVA